MSFKVVFSFHNTRFFFIIFQLIELDCSPVLCSITCWRYQLNVVNISSTYLVNKYNKPNCIYVQTRTNWGCQRIANSILKIVNNWLDMLRHGMNIIMYSTSVFCLQINQFCNQMIALYCWIKRQFTSALCFYYVNISIIILHLIWFFFN